MADAARPRALDRDAIIEGLQDQIDELTATVEAQQNRIAGQQRQLDALDRLVTLLARRAGLPGTARTGH